MILCSELFPDEILETEQAILSELPFIQINTARKAAQLEFRTDLPVILMEKACRRKRDCRHEMFESS